MTCVIDVCLTKPLTFVRMKGGRGCEWLSQGHTANDSLLNVTTWEPGQTAWLMKHWSPDHESLHPMCKSGYTSRAWSLSIGEADIQDPWSSIVSRSSSTGDPQLQWETLPENIRWRRAIEEDTWILTSGVQAHTQEHVTRYAGIHNTCKHALEDSVSTWVFSASTGSNLIPWLMVIEDYHIWSQKDEWCELDSGWQALEILNFRRIWGRKWEIHWASLSLTPWSLI